MKPAIKPSESVAMTTRFKIGENYTVHVALNQVSKRGNNNGRKSEIIKVEPRIMHVLTLLANRPAEVLSREYLIETVWENQFVGEEGLTQAISRLRNIFGDKAQHPQFIETIPKKGYRLIAQVKQNAESSASMPEPLRPQARDSRKKKFIIPAIGMITIVVGLIAAILLFDKFSRADNKLLQQSPLLYAIPVTSDPGPELYPALSPQGDYIAFAKLDSGNNNFDIYVTPTTRDEVVRLTNDNADNVYPVWSPDGRFILYSRMKDGYSDIYVTSFPGGESRQLLRCAEETMPTYSWAPDGKQIALSEQLSRSEPYRIFLFRLDNHKKKQISLPPLSNYGDTMPAFSPDGERIAFKRLITAATGDIFTIDIRNYQETQITNNSQWVGSVGWLDAEKLLYTSAVGSYSSLWQVSVNGGEPVWFGGENVFQLSTAADGNSLAFSRSDYNIDIYRQNISGNGNKQSVPEKILASTKTEWAPSVSPDGKQIAYISDQSGYREIWLCDRTGKNRKQLTSIKEKVVDNLSWSPNGNFIAFAIMEDGKHSILLAPVAGGLPLTVVQGRFNNHLPTWSINGNDIYFISDRKDGQQVWKKTREDSLHQITSCGAVFAREAFDGRLYFTRPDTCGLWTLATNGEEPKLVMPNVSNEDYKNWLVSSRGIYFIDRKRIPAPAVSFFEMTTGEVTPMLSLEKREKFYRLSISVDPANEWLYYTIVDRLESDIMLVRL